MGRRVPVERYLRALRAQDRPAVRGRLPPGRARGRRRTPTTLGAFGRRIGLAFQLLDDVLDVSGPGGAHRQAPRHRPPRRHGHAAVILARERDPELAALDPRAIRDAADAERVCDRIAATGALDDARRRALEIVDEAKARLRPDLPARQRAALELVADGVVARYA